MVKVGVSKVIRRLNDLNYEVTVQRKYQARQANRMQHKQHMSINKTCRPNLLLDWLVDTISQKQRIQSIRSKINDRKNKRQLPI